MDQFAQDAKFALRTLARDRRFTLMATLTLGLGLGATVAMFSVVQGVLLRSLPYKDPGRLVFISQTDGIGTQPFPISSPGHYRDYQEQAKQFEEFAAGGGFTQTLESVENGPAAEQVQTGFISTNFFPMLGVAPVMGRNFTSEEGMFNGPQVAILSDRIWRRRYNGDPNILNKTIKLGGGRPTLVIGVLPADFKLYLPSDRIFLKDAEIYVPTRIAPQLFVTRRNSGFLTVIGRLRKETDLRSAQAEMDRIASNFRRDYDVDKLADLHITVVPMLDLVVKQVRPALLTIMGVVGLVLIIACANVANLFLARAAGRGREIAVRVALGATRARIVRQVLTEGLVLGGLGLLFGLMVAAAGTRLLLALHPSNLPRLENIHIDGTALAFAVLATLATALLFSLAPALSMAPEEAKAQNRGSIGVGKKSVRSALIIGEIAVSCVLLVMAGLLLRSFAALQKVDPGYVTENVLTFQTALPFGRYTPDSATRFFTDLEQRLRTLPGVDSVGGINLLPLGSSSNPFGYAPESAPDSWAARAADTRIVTPGYFKTTGIRLKAGRLLNEQDDAGHPLVIVVDEDLARKTWPGENPLGKKLSMTQFQANAPPVRNWWQVVGVVEHVRNESLTDPGMVQIYRPQAQELNFGLTMLVRATGRVEDLEHAAEAELHKLDKDVPMHHPETMHGYVKIAQAPMQFNLVLIGAFALMAVALASVGLYGVIAYLVAQRTRELGVRIALGAQRKQVLGLILGQGLKLAAIGLVTGILVSLAASRAISSQLFEVKSTDPMTFLLAPVVLATVALLASFVPGRRASKLDPMVALRDEGQ